MSNDHIKQLVKSGHLYVRLEGPLYYKSEPTIHLGYYLANRMKPSCPIEGLAGEPEDLLDYMKCKEVPL
jgi:hypothetical protein